MLSEFFKLWQTIEAANLNLDETEEDSIVWTLENSGEYSTRSAYAVQFAGNLASNHPALIWRVWAPPKYKYFVWLLLQNRLWTAVRPCLVSHPKNFYPSHRIFGHMHKTLNVNKKIN